MLVIADTSPLIGLLKIGCAGVLPLFQGAIAPAVNSGDREVAEGSVMFPLGAKPRH